MRPFGEYVEGLSHFRDESYADEREVRAGRPEQFGTHIEIRLNPLVFQALRKFERSQGEIDHLFAVLIGLVELQLQPSLFVPHPRLAFKELIGVDLAGHPHVGEAVLLISEQVQLSGRLTDRRLSLLSVLQGFCAEGLREQFANRRVFKAESLEHRQHLLVEVGLGHAVLRVPFCPPILRTPVIAVLLLALLLDDLLAENGAATVPAPDQAIAIGEVQNGLRLVAQHRLNAVPRLPVDERLVMTGEPLVVVLDLADVEPVLEHRVQVAEVPLRLLLGERDALLLELLTDAIQAQVRVGVKLEHALDFLGVLWVGFEYITALTPHEVVAVVGAAVWQAVLRALGLTLPDVHRHLLGEERGRTRREPSSETPGRGVLEVLGNRDERDAVLALQPLQFDVIGQVPRRPVDLGEHHPGQFVRVGFGVIDEFAERRALDRPRGGFGDPPDADEFPSLLLDVPPDFLLLSIEGEPLAFLLAA